MKLVINDQCNTINCTIRCGWKLGNLFVDKQANIPSVFRINPFSARGPLP